ncbi:GDNF family receptor alpha-3 [Gastrophryne carolinensis]
MENLGEDECIRRSLSGCRRMVANADLLSANFVEIGDCISLEQSCLKDAECEVSYNVFKNCTGTDFLDSVGSEKCKNAAEVLSKNNLMTCKCHRRMRRDELCLNIYWTLHPNYVNGYLGSYDSPYLDEEVDTKGIAEYARHAESGLYSDSKNPCLKEASICNDNEKCIKLKNNYVMHCSSSTADGCDQRKCHNHLRQFFTRVPMEFTKRLLFCPCNQDSACAERRRQNIVPKCSFEDKNKKNCLGLYDACMSDNICKSRLLDYRKNCHLFDKKTDICPSEKHNQCIQSYMGMIGTVMTPNFISNSSMEVSLWCTCEGSANREEECESVRTMFTSNKCLKSAIHHNLLVNVDEEFPMSFEDKPDTSLFFSPLDQVPGTINAKVLLPNQQMPSNTASGVSSPSLAFALLNPALFLWLLKVMYI